MRKRKARTSRDGCRPSVRGQTCTRRYDDTGKANPGHRLNAKRLIRAGIPKKERRRLDCEGNGPAHRICSGSDAVAPVPSSTLHGVSWHGVRLYAVRWRLSKSADRERARWPQELLEDRQERHVGQEPTSSTDRPEVCLRRRRYATRCRACRGPTPYRVPVPVQ